MNITKNTIKEILKNIMKEESEYQTFFKKALEKAGKSIPSMSDEEKKEFFNKIDAAWNAKGEKNEALKGNQHKLDVDGDGEIEASDLAALRAGKKPKNESHDCGCGCGGVTEGGCATSIVEKVSSKDMESIKSAVQSASSFMNIGSELKKLGMKYIFATSPMPIYVVQDKGGNRVGIVNKKYATKPDFIHGDTAVGVMESIKLVKEEKYTVIDPKGNQKGVGLKIQAAAMAKKMGGEKAGYFVVPNKNALKARRALEKFKGDFKNPKLKDIMSDLFYESVESVNEGRAFINAARKAKAEGKTEFEFNGKTYPVTIKESVVNEDRTMNVKVKQLLDKELKDLSKGRPNHQFAVMHILKGALTDANFHSEAKKVPAIFGSKAKYEGDPQGEQDLIDMYEYEIGPKVANICKWDGKDIVDAIGFYVSMTIGRPVGEKVEKLVESINEAISLLQNKK